MRRSRASLAFAPKTVERHTYVGSTTGEEFEMLTTRKHGTAKIAAPASRVIPEGHRRWVNQRHANLIAADMLGLKRQCVSLHPFPCRKPACCPSRASDSAIVDYARRKASRHSEHAINMELHRAAAKKRAMGIAQ